MTDQEKKDLFLKTITTHTACVREMCDLMNIHELGMQHDLSKFSPEEFEQYKYIDEKGSRSPHEGAREHLGYSPYWCFHKNKNPHHWEYWLDSEDATPNGDGTFTMIVVPCKMPYEYVIEMCCDFVGASKAYKKEAFDIKEPWNYWVSNCENKRAMHKVSEYLIKKLLWNLHEADSIESFGEWYRNAEQYLRRNYENNNINY